MIVKMSLLKILPFQHSDMLISEVFILKKSFCSIQNLCLIKTYFRGWRGGTFVAREGWTKMMIWINFQSYISFAQIFLLIYVLTIVIQKKFWHYDQWFGSAKFLGALRNCPQEGWIIHVSRHLLKSLVGTSIYLWTFHLSPRRYMQIITNLFLIKMKIVPTLLCGFGANSLR